MTGERAPRVQIFHRLNKLRLKAGLAAGDKKAGFIDPAAVLRAQTAIDKTEARSGREMSDILGRLTRTWADARKADIADIRTQIDRLYNYANNVKDLADTYHYGLMKHFSESLRDFCEKIDMSKDEHKVIVQAHIDVMHVAYNDNIRDQTGTRADELKDIVARAIGKYSA